MHAAGPIAPTTGNPFPADSFELQVGVVSLEADDTISLILRDKDGRDLPPWTPGAHIDLVLPSGLIRQYSLCGDPRDAKHYRIAVLREKNGRGGSLELHNLPLVGRNLKVRGPRNHFKREDHPAFLFIAGGIGITPILAMISDLPPDTDWTLYYGGRSRQTMAFVDEAAAIGGDRVHIVPEDQAGLLDLQTMFTGLTADTAIYCCGPERLLKAVEERRSAVAPDSPLYFERFTPAAEPKSVTRESLDDEPFVVELRRSGLVLDVPADRSLLSVIREALPDVAYSCEEGYCGTCETRVLDGIPDHRDDLLSEDERAANKTMMTCVGRAKSERLVLDL